MSRIPSFPVVPPAADTALAEALFDTLPFPVDVVDEQGRVLFASARLQEAGLVVNGTSVADATCTVGGRTFEVHRTAIVYGGRKAVLEVFVDITDRLRQQAALEESEARYRRLNDDARDLIWRTDPKGTVLYVNHTSSRLLGVSPQEAVGLPLERYLSPDSIARTRAAVAAALAGPTPTSHYELVADYLHRDGTRVTCEVVARLVVDERGRLQSVEGISRDVRERRRVEQELSASLQLYHGLVEASQDLIWRTDREGRFTYLNPAWKRTHGYPVEQMVGRPYADFAAPGAAERDREAFMALIAGGVMDGYETTQLRQDGTVIHLLVSAVPWKDEAGQIIGAHGTAVDLTEQKKLHARLQHAERLTTVGTLAAGVAHEINNPLAYVVSNLAFARDELKEALATGAPRPSLERGAVEEVVKSLEDASMGADRVRRIVRDLKVFSRRESAELGPVSVEQSLEAALKMAHNELRFRAQVVRRYSDVPPVEANEAQLGQVFLNLLINAAQAIPEGHASRNEVCVSTQVTPEGKVVVEVRDTGSGIPPEVLPRIFDPFFTTKQVGVGTGLGLSTCHGIVKGLGGELLVETRVGEGTAFKVVLPPSRGERPSPTPQPVPPAVRRGRILVVDDEVAVGRVLSKMLQSAHEVVVLNDGREALRRIAAGERFDVILCDLMMPDLSGCELHAELEKVAQDAAQRMVFVTGGAFSPEAVAFLERVPNRQLDKPINRVALGQALNALLGLQA